MERNVKSYRWTIYLWNLLFVNNFKRNTWNDLNTYHYIHYETCYLVLPVMTHKNQINKDVSSKAIQNSTHVLEIKKNSQMLVCFGFNLMQNPHPSAFLYFQTVTYNSWHLICIFYSWMFFQKQVACVQCIEIIRDHDSHFLHGRPSSSGWNVLCK